MKKLVVLAIVACTLACPVAGVAGSRPLGQVTTSSVPGVIAIQLKRETYDKLQRRSSVQTANVGIESLDNIATRRGVISIEPMFPGATPRMYNGRTIDLSGWYLVRFDPSEDVAAVAGDYSANPYVLSSAVNDVVQTDGTPNDALFSNQYHASQASDHDIDAPEAWNIETGDSSIIVAVIDEGVYYFHKDLGGANASNNNRLAARGNMWINEEERTGVIGVDDDDNGFTDDWIGWDFVGDTSEPAPNDGATHGTLIAGLIAALTNDGYGTAGVAGGWHGGSQPVTGNGVRIMALRCGTSAGIGSFEAAEGFYYAAENGAHIANLSRRVVSSNTALIDAIYYFLAGGGLVFKAAGNTGSLANDYFDPGDDVISVAGTDQYDRKWDGSNYGSGVDICAAGYGVWTTTIGPSNSDAWGAATGTSFSTPIAAGAAALIWSANPGWTAEQVKDQLLGSAENIDEYLQPQYVGQMGSGRVNVFYALAQTIHVPSEAPTIQTAIDALGNSGLVLVAPGTYSGTGNVNIRFHGKAIEVASELGPEQTIIDCGDSARGFIFDGGETREAILTGFTIRNGRISNNYGGGILIMQGEGEPGGEGEPTPLIPSSPTIRRCLVRDCHAVKGGGVYIAQGNHPLIQGCTFVHDSAGQGGGVMYGYAMSAYDQFDQNIVAYNTGEGLRGRTSSNGSLNYSCNVFWQNTVANTAAISGTGLNNQTADPLFCDLAGNDFRISAHSPADIHNSACGIAGGALGRCETPFATRGDVNLNGTPFEAADYSLFRQWFHDGNSAFTINLDQQRKATDANCDGLVLSAEDVEVFRGMSVGGGPQNCTSTPIIVRLEDTMRVIDTSYTKGSVRKGLDFYIARYGSVTDGMSSGLTARLTYNPQVFTPHWDTAYGDNRHVEYQLLGELAASCYGHQPPCHGEVIVTSETPGEIVISWIYPVEGQVGFPVFQGSQRILRVFIDVANSPIMPMSTSLTLANAGYYDNHFNQLGTAVVPTRVAGLLTIPPPPSCPVLYSYDGTAFAEENPLLTECENFGYSRSVTDYYQVKNVVQPRNGVVKFQLRELEDEITTVEGIELMTIDHPAGTEVAVANDGSITTYSNTVYVISALDDQGMDHAAELRAKDGVLFRSLEAGTLTLTFPHDAGGIGGLVLAAGPKPQCPIEPPPEPVPPSTTPVDLASTGTPLTVEQKDASSEWKVVTSLPSRSYATEETVTGFAQSGDGSHGLTLRISWGDYYTADAVYLIEGSSENHSVAKWSPRAVTVPASAGASWTDFNASGPLTLRKGDTFEFAFEAGTGVGAETRRDYVIVARGNYRPDDAVYPAAAPKEFALFANYPNPFNASTTIGFSLSQQQNVRLEIFNILGQSVAVLADGEFPEGTHNLTWDATDGNKHPVASGTYMYRITAGRNVDTRKMIVLK